MDKSIMDSEDEQQKQIFLDELELIKSSTSHDLDESQLNENLQSINKTLESSEELNYLINSSSSNNNQDIYQTEHSLNTPMESVSSCFLLSHFSSNQQPPTLTSTASLFPHSPTSSSSSSLSLSLDASDSSNFLLNQRQSLCNFQQKFTHQYTANNFSFWNNSNNFASAPFLNTTTSLTCVKHDASVGTELSFTKDLRSKKDFLWSNLKVPIETLPNTVLENNTVRTSPATTNAAAHNNNIKNQQMESFKLIEKIQPKKSRTKYSKEQISYLESAYAQSPYPDLILIEHLCKTIQISKEKINIWFQNRRARSKRVYKVKSSPNTSNMAVNFPITQQQNNFHTNHPHHHGHSHHQMNKNFTLGQYDLNQSLF